MGYRWAANTEFKQVILNVEEEGCSLCQGPLHVCDHRYHHIHSLEGPLELVCKLAHCPDPCCPAHHRTLSPAAESQITLPWWSIGWDVFSWLGFRRFKRHWSVPQLQAELKDCYQIRLSDDAIAGYLQRYRYMVAARHQDASLLKAAYEDIDFLALTIDGLQPEKGHETLYVIRELCAKRVWFAEALLSSSAAEVQRLLAKAKQWALQLNKPVKLCLSDKQDAFLTGFALEFPGVPHRYCQNHFIRDVAKPMLENDSHAKVQMRKKVRGLRDIERQVLEHRKEAENPSAKASPPGSCETAVSEPVAIVTAASCTARSEPVIGEPAISTANPGETAVSEPVAIVTAASETACSEPVAGEPAISTVNGSETAASAPVTTVVAASEMASSEPAASESGNSLANTSCTACNEPVASEPVISVANDSETVVGNTTDSSETVMSEPVAVETVSETATSAPVGSEPAVSKAAGNAPGRESRAASQVPAAAALAGNEQRTAGKAATVKAAEDPAGDVVLDYCAAVRGILNDDQGGPLHPPGVRMAEALQEVRESLQRNLDEKKGGRAEKQLEKLAGCIDRGLQEVAQQQKEIKEQAKEVKRIEATLDPSKGSVKQRKKRLQRLRRRLARSGDPVRMHMATVIVAFMAGLFAGPEAMQKIRDNLELERWFRLPKGHERRIHGRKHAGVRLVQQGATLMPTLDAHKDRETPFTPDELLPHKDAKAPKEELEAIHRRKIMRRARSKKRRPALLAELERRYKAAP